MMSESVRNVICPVTPVPAQEEINAVTRLKLYIFYLFFKPKIFLLSLCKYFSSMSRKLATRRR